MCEKLFSDHEVESFALEECINMKITSKWKSYESKADTKLEKLLFA